MRNFTLYTLVISLAALASPGMAEEATPQTEAATNAAIEQTANDEKQDNRWRYKRHNGQWWYWMPGEYWVYYDAGRWVVYDRQTYRRPQTATGYYSGGTQYRSGRGGGTYRGGSRVGGAFSHIDASDGVDLAEDIASTIFTFSW